MSLFQKTVINKYLNQQDKNLLTEKWEVYKSHFHNPIIQENIRTSKEEQYQGEFLIDLFVNVLGYTKNPTPDFNLDTELKNIKDSKKADGGIIIDGKIIGVIELKGTNTTDLSKVEVQAFGYKNNQPDCIYIITSNFEKLRFYIDNAVENVEFNLFLLSETDFQLLYLCLAFDNIKNGIPKRLKEESVSQEDIITKKLYKDYSLFKRELFRNLTELNPEYKALELFKKSQKLLDRFLFLLFAEDRFLLPPNSVRLILNDWDDLQDRDEEVPLYNRFKKYFNYLNTGFKGKRYDVFAYNGGLFKPDEILDNIKIDCQLLYKHTSKLAEYDFASEVDVNILGHIFENSLNDLDEIKAQLEGQEIDKSKTKRKKDGVYYTPKYITKYIVDNTVGKLCIEKKAEFGVLDEDYYTDKKRQQKTKQNLLDKLNNYRKWLLDISILDPACGSGAFLSEALNFLIHEHHYINELETKIAGGSIVFSYDEVSILENNIYGVDLNEESVEIAKLSLWLRTAKKDRKLNDLNDKIKCGNSVIDDIEIVGDKAFNWENEFSHIFAKGGFDIVIGNPPYVSNWTLTDSDKKSVEWLSKRYDDVLVGHWDLFICFISLSFKILKKDGYNGFILPTSFLKEKYGKQIRNQIVKEKTLIEIIDFGEQVIFENVARQTFIYIIKNTLSEKNKTHIKFGIEGKGNLISQSFFAKLKNTSFKTNVSDDDILVFQKLEENSLKLGEIVCLNVGVVAHSKIGSPKKFKKDDVIFPQYEHGYKHYLIGSNIKRYNLYDEGLYIDYDTNVDYFHRPKFKLLFESEKLIVRRTSGNNNTILCVYDNEKYYSNDSLMHLVRWNKEILKFQKPENRWIINLNDNISLKYILCIISSKVVTYFFSKFLSTDTLQGAYSSIYPEDLREFPIKNIPLEEQQNFIRKADEMLSLNKNVGEISKKFQRTLKRKFDLEKLSKKLEKWFELSYQEFIKELQKNKIKLSLSEEAEWEDYFSQEKEKATEINSKINQTDKEIDMMVYELYGLSKEEIDIIEIAND